MTRVFVMILCPSTPPRTNDDKNPGYTAKNFLVETWDLSKGKKGENVISSFCSPDLDASQAGVISSFHIQFSNRGERRNHIRRLVRLFKDLVKKGNFKGEIEIKEIYPRFKKQEIQNC